MLSAFMSLKQTLCYRYAVVQLNSFDAILVQLTVLKTQNHRVGEDRKISAVFATTAKKEGKGVSVSTVS